MGNNILVNADTDSIMVCKPDQTAWTKEEQALFLQELNNQFPELINWDHDGVYDSVVVIKSKNYALLPQGEKKIKLKGSSIKDQKKEPALREMMDRIIDIIINDKEDSIIDLYHEYIKEAMNPKQVRRWCQKKSVTESVLSCRGYENIPEGDDDSPRKNEIDIWEAIKNEEGVQQGDKIYLYPIYVGKKKTEIKKYKKNKETGENEFIGYSEVMKDVYALRLDKYYKNDIATEKLLKRVYDTLNIFKSIINMDLFVKYHSAKNKQVLENLLNG